MAQHFSQHPSRFILAVICNTLWVKYWHAATPKSLQQKLSETNIYVQKTKHFYIRNPMPFCAFLRGGGGLCAAMRIFEIVNFYFWIIRYHYLFNRLFSELIRIILSIFVRDFFLLYCQHPFFTSPSTIYLSRFFWPSRNTDDWNIYLPPLSSLHTTAMGHPPSPPPLLNVISRECWNAFTQQWPSAASYIHS